MARSKFNLDHFASRANEAAFWESWVGAVLARCGLYTIHHPFTVARDITEVGGYAESWDLEVASDREGPWVNLEVKSKAEPFGNDPMDFPFSTAIVCSASSHRRRHKQTSAAGSDYVLVSTVTGAMLWIPRGTILLPSTTVTDAKRGETYKAVAVSKGCLRGLKDYTKTFGR